MKYAEFSGIRGNWHAVMFVFLTTRLIISGCVNDPHRRTEIAAAIDAAADDGAKGALIGARRGG